MKIKIITIIMWITCALLISYGVVTLLPKQTVVKTTLSERIEVIVKELDNKRNETINKLNKDISQKQELVTKYEEDIINSKAEIEFNTTCLNILQKKMGTVEAISDCSEIIINNPITIEDILSNDLSLPAENTGFNTKPIVIDEKKKLTTNLTTNLTTGNKINVKLSRTSYRNGQGNERPRNETMQKYNRHLDEKSASQEYITIPSKFKTIEERAQYMLEKNGRDPGSYARWEKNSKNIGIKTEFAICLSKSETSLGQANKSLNNYFNCGNNDRGDTISANDLEHNFRQLSSKCLQNQYQYMKTTLHHLYPNSPDSRCINKRDIPECIYVYASSPLRAPSNVRNCLSQIYDKEITMDYTFRLAK